MRCYPSLQEATRLAGTYNVVPIVRERMADTETPIRVFRGMAERRHAFLLESADGGARWGRYSFLGADPFLVVRGKAGRFELIYRDRTETVRGRPIELLGSLMEKYRAPVLPDLPPFAGGAIGYFAYDLLRYYERLPAHRVDDLDMDDLYLMFCDEVVVFDHLRHRLLFIANMQIHPSDTETDIARSYREACERTERMAALVAAAAERSGENDPSFGSEALADDGDIGDVRSNMDQSRYEAMVVRAREYIRAGDIFQVVLSQRFEARPKASPFQIYRALRTLNPSPYMYYLKTDGETIVGSSPEMLVRVEDGIVRTRPIAGTRPRGQTPEEDEALERDLLADEKERAEHVMLVDLGRNDLGRVCEFGSVKCDSYMRIERYSHVMHIVTDVSGRLRKDKSAIDAFVSCLPAGTVSGAPKLRAMEIIAELEREARGPYAGAIGYWSFTGALNTCITIRTIIFKGCAAYVQAGAGIVWDSVPENEYRETVNKAKAMLRAVRIADRLFAENAPGNRLSGLTDTAADRKPAPNEDYYFLKTTRAGGDE